MRKLFSLSVALLAGCQMTQTEDANYRLIRQIHKDLLGKFTPVAQPVKSDVYVNHSGEERFTGDCDDFLAAAKNQLIKYGFTPVAVTGYSKNRTFHVFMCADEGELICLDPNYRSPHRLRLLTGVYRQVTTYRYGPDDSPQLIAKDP